MAAHQAPASLGFSRQEHWSGLPFPSPMRESEVAQSCPTLSDPIDCSLPGSSVHGIFQARVLEWGAIAFSVQSHSQVLYLSLQELSRKPRSPDEEGGTVLEKTEALGSHSFNSATYCRVWPNYFTLLFSIFSLMKWGNFS